MNINDILPSENLVTVFKKLETEEFVKLREVCKLWWRLLDENKVFWRILKLQERRREEIRSTVDQFDEKSGSTIKELSFIVKQEELKESQNIEQITQLILKSKQALTILDIKSRYDISFQTLTNSLLPKLPSVVEFRASAFASRVQLLGTSVNRFGSFQILWIHSLQSLPSIYPHVSHPDVFQALASLQVEKSNLHSTWTEVLFHCSESLKHLLLCFHCRDAGKELSSLRFPPLEELEIDQIDTQFPTWMVVPSTLKLFTYDIQPNLPAIQELWVEYTWNWEMLSSRCPTLQVLRSNSDEPHKDLLPLLRARKENVNNGPEVDKIKIEPLKKLVILFEKFSTEQLEECRELVAEVVDCTGSGSQHWPTLTGAKNCLMSITNGSTHGPTLEIPQHWIVLENCLTNFGEER